MHASAYENCEKFYKKYCEGNIENKTILDVGSYDVNGTLKPIFVKGKYTGLDMEEGPNVDVVSSAHNIPFQDESFDIVLSSSCFEHDDMFWISFNEMCRVVNPGGYIYVQAPSNGPYHGWPGDNWRFYKDSWKALEKWGKQSGHNIELVESYISEPSHGDIWKDSVAVFRKKELKKVALISSFCNNQEKKDVLKKNIKIVKSHNIDVILISPFYLEKDIVDMCDYFFVTKDNPVFQWPERAIYMWRIFDYGNQNIKITTTIDDYGYAGLCQVKQLSELGISLGYEQFYHIIYDIIIDDNVIEGFKSNKKNSIYPSKRGNEIWDVGLHYMIFNKENLKNFIDKIDKNNYLELKGEDAFGWLHKYKNTLNYDIEQIPVEDEIFYYQDHDFFNFSNIEGLKFFIEKNDETSEPIKLLFYDITETKTLKVKVDGLAVIYGINNLDIISLEFNKTNIKQVSIEYDGTDYDITPIIKKIKHNTLSYIKK